MKTIKIIIASLAIMLTTAANSTLKAQAFNENSSIFSVGIGIPNELQSILSDFGTGASGGPVFHICYEHGVSEDWSIGGFLGYASVTVPGESGYGDPNTWSYIPPTAAQNYSALLIGVRGDYHFGNEHIDAYAGAGLAYVTVSAGADGGSFSGLGYYPHIGIRLPFSPNFGGFAELGYGISILNAGIAFSLK